MCKALEKAAKPIRWDYTEVMLGNKQEYPDLTYPDLISKETKSSYLKTPRLKFATKDKAISDDGTFEDVYVPVPGWKTFFCRATNGLCQLFTATQFMYGVQTPVYRRVIEIIQEEQNPMALFRAESIRTWCNLLGIPMIEGNIPEIAKKLTKCNMEQRKSHEKTGVFLILTLKDGFAHAICIPPNKPLISDMIERDGETAFEETFYVMAGDKKAMIRVKEELDKKLAEMAQQRIQEKQTHKTQPKPVEGVYFFDSSASKKQCQKMIDLVAIGSQVAKKKIEALKSQMNTT